MSIKKHRVHLFYLLMTDNEYEASFTSDSPLWLRANAVCHHCHKKGVKTVPASKANKRTSETHIIGNGVKAHRRTN